MKKNEKEWKSVNVKLKKLSVGTYYRISSICLGDLVFV